MSEINYAGKVENGIVIDSIAGYAEWATENLGGEWHDSIKPIWIGGTWDAEYGFRPPQPSPDCEWVDGDWLCPETEEE